MDITLTPRLVKMIREKTSEQFDEHNVIMVFNSFTGEMYFARGEDAETIRSYRWGLRARGKIGPYFKKGTDHYEGYTTPGRFCRPSQSACLDPDPGYVVAKIRIIPDCDEGTEHQLLLDALAAIREAVQDDV